MSKLNEIQRKLLEIDATKFHKLGDAYLSKRYGYKIKSTGTKNAEYKSRTGTPDTYFYLDNGKYVLVEYTTQETGIRDKFIKDIEKCLDESKTKIDTEKIDKIILVSNRQLSIGDEEVLRRTCHPINCEVLTNSSLSNDMYNHTPRIVNDYLGIKINEIIVEKLPHDMQDMLKNSIEREIENKIFSAITQKENNVVVLQGEEGVGKTVLSLQIAQKLSGSKYIIRFFKSSGWEQYSNINNLFINSEVDNFEEIITEEENNIIIFLDGVNERNALQAANRLLENFHSLLVEIKNKITLVFTTRELSSYTEYKQSEWNIHKIFKVKRFTEDELQKAISKIDSDYNFEDFPKELKSIASIPRYLHLAFQLKDKLGGYTNISKEILYWEGLKEQLKNDPKIREQGFTETSDIESVLLEICESITIENDKAIINQKSFKEYFGDDYRKVKTPFIESRMVTSSDNNKIELNFDMVVIGYAVYILTLFDEIDISSSVEEIADFFKEKLEPYVNDNMSKVPFMVFQLSLDKDISIEEGKLSKIYAGLLYLWLDNQNSSIDIENLEYWCKKDFVSFIMILDIIELRHINFNRLSLKNGMLKVLSDRWSMSGAEDVEIRSYLDDVLSINISSDINDRKKLMRRAIRIIFSYPTKYFLDKFLEIHKALAEIDTEESLLCKDSLDKYLSILLRFGYKEDIFEYLLEDRQYDEFSMIFRSHELSEKIGTPIENNSRLSLLEKIEAKEELLKDFTVESGYIHDLSFFSFRRDLELSNKDKITIKTTLNNLASSYISSEFMGGGRGDNVDIDFLILLASFDSDTFNSINQIFLYESISQKARLTDIEKFDLCMFQNDKIVKFIIQNLNSLIKIEDKNERDRYIDKLIEIILFSADEEKMLEFFDLIIDKSCSVCLSKDTAKYIKPISGNKLLSLIKNKIEVYHFENINDPKLYENYMTYLFMLKDYQNSFLRDWIIQIASTIEENKKLNSFHAEVLVTVLPVVEYFDKFNVKELLPNTGNYLSYWITSEDNFLDKKTFEELIELLPIDYIGEILYENERYEDINKWGIALFKNYNSMSSMQYLGLKKPLEIFSKNNEDLFLEYTDKYLNEVMDTGILFTGGLKDDLIELLMKVDFQKAMKVYESDDRKSINSNIIQSLFNVEQCGDSEHMKYRKKFILKSKNDLEYLQIVIMAFQGNTNNEVLKICEELLKSRYTMDRLKAISMIMWFATPDEIEILKNLKLNDDSDYVRKYAQWAEQVALQERYTREICEEAFYEKDKLVLSGKLYQIKNSLTPTFSYWGVEIIEKCRESNKSELDRVYIQRFLNRTEKKRKMTDKFEISGRKLLEYYCGEKMDGDFKYILGMY